MYSELNDLLRQAGMAETDVCVYLELLRHPCDTIWELVSRTGLSKSSVYRAFENLQALEMAEKNKSGIRALTLKSLVRKLYNKERKFGKLADKIKVVAPFLRAPAESVEEFETFYDADQIRNAYLSMSQLEYGVNLDFGDFENFIPTIGGLALANKFRANRAKHAGHHAICSTFGPLTAYFCTRDSAVRFKNKVDRADIDFKNRFIIFSDTSDYVFFGDSSDSASPTAVIIKSKQIADAQRLQFANFSQRLGNS